MTVEYCEIFMSAIHALLADHEKFEREDKERMEAHVSICPTCQSILNSNHTRIKCLIK